jgi:glycosyltransferase involved in cell wall biosynthesis
VIAYHLLSQIPGDRAGTGIAPKRESGVTNLQPLKGLNEIVKALPWFEHADETNLEFGQSKIGENELVQIKRRRCNNKALPGKISGKKCPQRMLGHYTKNSRIAVFFQNPLAHFRMYRRTKSEFRTLLICRFNKVIDMGRDDIQKCCASILPCGIHAQSALPNHSLEQIRFRKVTGDVAVKVDIGEQRLPGVKAPNDGNLTDCPGQLGFGNTVHGRQAVVITKNCQFVFSAQRLDHVVKIEALSTPSRDCVRRKDQALRHTESAVLLILDIDVPAANVGSVMVQQSHPELNSAGALHDRQICFAANSKEGHGGQGEFLRQMAATLQILSRGHIISRHCQTPVAKKTNIPFGSSQWLRLLFRVSQMPVLRRRQDWATLLSDLDFDQRLSSLVGHPDLFDGIAGQCAMTMRRLSSCYRVVTCLNTHILFLERSLREEFRRIGYSGYSFIHPQMRRRMLEEFQRADAIRVNSQLAKRTFVENGVQPERVTVIYPGVDLDHFRPVTKSDDVFRVLAVGTIDPRKGTLYLLKAFVEAAIPGSELLLIGTTGDRWSKQMLKSLRGHANIRIISRDVCTDPVEDTYGAASVVVHPAIEDGFGLVVSQALASGRPVIASRMAGASEFVSDGENGFVVDSGSVSQLKDRLRCLAADEAFRHRLQTSARASVLAYSVPAFVQRVLSFYAACLAHAA